METGQQGWQYLRQTKQTLKRRRQETKQNKTKRDFVTTKGSLQEDRKPSLTWMHPAQDDLNKATVTGIRKRVTIVRSQGETLPLHCHQRTDPPDRKATRNTAVFSDKQDQIDLMDIRRAFHPKAAEYTFLPNTHGTFSRKV